MSPAVRSLRCILLNPSIGHKFEEKRSFFKKKKKRESY
uniref:Uncharacterized protein n=1 Tax=Kalanchoe fedtschenkoi TaxID=63787 RepID=A0A7N0RIK0_KALFE